MEVLVTIDGRDTVRLELPSNYFGVVQFQFVNDEIVLIRKEESLKPQFLSIVNNSI